MASTPQPPAEPKPDLAALYKPLGIQCVAAAAAARKAKSIKKPT